MTVPFPDLSLIMPNHHLLPCGIEYFIYKFPTLYLWLWYKTTNRLSSVPQRDSQSRAEGPPRH